MFSPQSFKWSCTLAFVLSLSSSSFLISHATAASQEDIQSPKGDIIFQVHFDQRATFSDPEKQIIKDAFSYWARILKKADNGIPAIIQVRKVGMGADNKVLARYFGQGSGLLLDPLMKGKQALNDYGHGLIEINGDQEFSSDLGPRFYYSLGEEKDLYNVIIHEIGHGLFNDRAKTDGIHIKEVLETQKEYPVFSKIPLENNHIHLPQSVMSPSYKSSRSFIEAELAFLQDQGWSIDRRNFFGYSLYQNNQDFTNNRGYFARNSEGSNYIVGQDNLEPRGIGFHLYGNYNDVTQNADILTKGEGAIGILVNGTSNNLTINENKKVYSNGVRGVGILIEEENNNLIINKNAEVRANGPDGIGILFAAGKEHGFTLHGSVIAEGEKGVGLRFDFLNPVAKTVHINGTLSGQNKAIYIGENGFIRDIKIAADAKIKGDIVSDNKDADWDPYLTHVTFGDDTRKGKKFQESNNAETNKSFIYSHSLKGHHLKVEVVDPTAFYNNQTHEIQNITILPGASLEGNGTFRLATWEDSSFHGLLKERLTTKEESRITQEDYEVYQKSYAPLYRGYFYNQGVLSPGSETSAIGAMRIEGSFWQDERGTLAIDIDENGVSDALHVTGNAYLGGTLNLRPQATFFPADWEQSIIFLTADGGIKNDFHAIAWESPISQLNFTSVKAPHSYGVHVSDTHETHTPRLDPHYKNELEAIQNHQSDSRMRQDNPELWKEVSQKRREQEAQNRREERDRYEQQREQERREDRLKQEQYEQRARARAEENREHERLAQKREVLSKRAEAILSEYNSVREQFDQLIANYENMSPSDQEKENTYREQLNKLRNDYKNLLEEFYPETNVETSDHQQSYELRSDEKAKGDSKLYDNFSLLAYKDLEKPREILQKKVSLTIPEDAYSRYATTGNERSVGQVLDHVRRLSKEAVIPALKALYASLDSSSPDGSQVASALRQLSPVAYGAAFAASLDREYVISDTLRARPSLSASPMGRWYGFALPFASQSHEKSLGQQVGYNARTSGVIFGVEQDASFVKGLTWGFHGVVTSKASLSVKTPDNTHGDLQAWGLGIQMRYRPSLHAGVDVTAHARLGLENGNMTRSLSFASYGAEQKGKWSGWTSSSAVFGAYLWPLSSSVSIGPMVGLEYIAVSRPDVVERGSQALDFVLDRAAFDSLRSSLGMRGVIFASEKLTMELHARWDRELLSRTVKQRISFAGYEDRIFYAESVSVPLEDVQVSGQMTYDVSSKVSIGARAAAQFSRDFKPELSGNLALKVRF